MQKTTKPTTAVAEYDWSKSQVTGLENVTQQDLGIPFLQILQKGSPQVDEAHPEHKTKKIDGAAVGDIVNTVSNTVVLSRKSGKVLEFIPCRYEKLFVEWTPREKGGGIVKTHQSAMILQECSRNQRGQDELKSGNIIVTTAYFYGLALIDGDLQQVIIGLSSTQLKKAKQWLNLIMALKFTSPTGAKYTPPMFSHCYALSSIPESNDKGNWYGWNIRCAGPVKSQEHIAAAIDAAKSGMSRTPTLPASTDEDSHAPFA